MILWTPDRYLELARACRDRSGSGRSVRNDALRAMAEEYEAKARSGGNLR